MQSRTADRINKVLVGGQLIVNKDDWIFVTSYKMNA